MSRGSALPLGLTALIGAALACNLPGLGPSSTIDPTPTQASIPEATGEIPSVEPAASSGPIPPGDYYEAIQARVETGQWTDEEGLLAVLRGFAGRADDPFADVDLGEREGTGVIREARRYLEEGEDPAVKAEIEELLAIILPTKESLLPYAVPESEARIGGGLAAPALADPLCADLYEEGFPPGSTAICYLFSETPLGEHAVDVFWPSEWSSGSAELAFAKAAGQAVVDAWNVYKAFGVQEGVLVVFALVEDSQPTTLAMVPTTGGEGECLIVVYPYALQVYSGTGLGIPGFKQTVAHEMFHCFQGWNYPKHFDEWAVQRWWGEGSAEYFSNLVYPTTNKEWTRRNSFAENSADVPVFAMAYENTFLFQFLEDKIGPQGLISLFHLLPTGQPLTGHMAVLSGYPGMSDYWHEFGRAVIDDAVPDTGGGNIPFPDTWTSKVGVAKTDTYDLPTHDFVLTRYDVALGGGLGYHVQVGQADVEILGAARPLATPGWTPVAIDRDAGCARYTVLVTSAGNQTTKRTYQLDAMVDQPNEGGVCDTCVLGRWRMTHESYLAVYQAVTAGAEGLPVSQMVTAGDLEMELRSDGTMTAEAMPFSVMTMGGVPDSFGDPIYVETTVTMSGPTEMTYLAMEGEFLMTVVISGTEIKTEVNFGGQTFEGPFGTDSAPMFGSGPPGTQQHHTYTCSATELQLSSTDYAYLTGGTPWVFKKLGN